MTISAEVKPENHISENASTCRSCGRTLAADELEGLCGACLWGSLVVVEAEPQPDTRAESTPLPRRDGYEY